MRRHHQIISATLATLVWAGWANATPEPDIAITQAGNEASAAPATWIPVDARNHARGTTGVAAVLFGVAHERGRSRPASLRVECFDGLTTVRLDADGLRPGPWAVEVGYRLDGGRFVAGSWQASADGSGLELAGDRAIQFMSELYGKSDLRLAVMRPLSVPFLLAFAVGGAEAALRPMAGRCQWSAGQSISDAGR